jgi:hypothetical protein
MRFGLFCSFFTALPTPAACGAQLHCAAAGMDNPTHNPLFKYKKRHFTNLLIYIKRRDLLTEGLCNAQAGIEEAISVPIGSSSRFLKYDQRFLLTKIRLHS